LDVPSVSLRVESVGVGVADAIAGGAAAGLDMAETASGDPEAGAD
jgi:hypothetical protein